MENSKGSIMKKFHLFVLYLLGIVGAIAMAHTEIMELRIQKLEQECQCEDCACVHCLTKCRCK